MNNNNNNLPSNEKDVPDCPAGVPVTSTNVPGVSDDQRLEISTQEGKCFRIFNCVDDKPVPYSEYTCKVSDIKGNWWGDHFYQDGLPVFVLNWDLGDPSGNKLVTRNVIARKEYLEIPAPNPAADMTWARYPILSDDGTNPAQFRYVERAWTKGGVPPASCNGQQSVQVPYQAFYHFYTCKDPKAAEAPKAPPKEAPVVAQVVAPVTVPVATVGQVPVEVPVEVPVPASVAEVPVVAPVEAPMEAPMELSDAVAPAAVPTKSGGVATSTVAGLTGVLVALTLVA